ncbi:MAG: MlaD family protein [Nitriliruptorales bacterium]|nr:MlaD family protein [Nitriliruptorales bacterium]
MDAKHPLLYFVIFTVVCLGFAAWIVGTIGNIQPFEDRTLYAAEFADVTGLIVNDAVKVSGVTVGKVTGIEAVPGGTARVEFQVDDELPLTEDTVVSVRWRDVFGLRFLYLAPGEGPDADPGYEFPLEQTQSPADLGVLLQRMVPVLNALAPDLQNQVLQAFQEALVGNEERIQNLISEGASLTKTLADQEQEIERLLQNSATILEAYSTRNQEFRDFLSSFANVSETIAARNDTLDQAIVQLASAQDELASMVDRNDEELDAAIDALDALTTVLSVNHDNLEDIVTYAGRGVVGYHLISSTGQWFNVNAVGGSSDYQTLSSKKGAELPRGEDAQHYEDDNHQHSSAASMSAFFRASLGGGG